MASGPVNIQNTISFGEDFELDIQAYRLRRSGRAVKLERIPTEILVLLIEHRSEIVTREQIAERIWGKDVFIDTDNSINGAIRKIRQVLRDDPEEPSFVQTVTGRGYRFIAPVADDQLPTVTTAVANPLAINQVPAANENCPASVPEATVRPSDMHKRLTQRLVVALALSITVIVGLSTWFVLSRARSHEVRAGRLMLAVLPLENLTGDSAQEYLSDGLTEEMITQLGNLDPQHLGVIARTSVMHYKNSHTPLDQVGRDLGVQYVMEGSVRRDADHIRVTAQLIQTKDQTHVWARQYDRELKDMLALQSEIAQEIADETQLTLEDHKRSLTSRVALSPQNYEAYDLYLRGEFFFNKRSAAALHQAAEYFQQAIGKDPLNARAYAGLADCYALLPGYSGTPQREYIDKARAAALKALQIEENLPEAHTALALLVQNYDWDWKTADKEFRRAIELNPNYATAHHWYAEHLMWRGQFEQALQESERARQLDPLSLIIATDNGAILYYSGRYDRAIQQWRSVLDMDPDFPRAHLIMAAYVAKRKFSEALADAETLRPKIPAAVYWSWIAFIQAHAGRTKEARMAIDNLLRADSHVPTDATDAAWAYAAIGDKKQALAWLERSYAQHSTELTKLKVDPDYDLLRGEPQFQDLLRRIGLAR